MPPFAPLGLPLVLLVRKGPLVKKVLLAVLDVWGCLAEGRELMEVLRATIRTASPSSAISQATDPGIGSRASESFETSSPLRDGVG